MHVDMLLFWLREHIFVRFTQKFYDSKGIVNILDISAESRAEARRAWRFLKFLLIFSRSLLTDVASFGDNIQILILHEQKYTVI